MIRKSAVLSVGVFICAALAVGTGLWLKSKASVSEQDGSAAVSAASAAMDKVQTEILEKSRKIQSYLAAQKSETDSKVFVQKIEAEGGSETELLAELTGYISCYSDAANCPSAPVKVNPENVRQTLESIEAKIRFEELNNEDMIGNQVLALMQLQPQYANTAIALLQEFSDSSSLAKVFELSSLQPEHKAKLIEASLDPADSLKREDLHQKARQLFSQMMENGNPSDAFAASSVIRLFPELKDEDYARMGQSLCRFSQSDSPDQGFAYESLKTKLKRFVTDRKRLNSMLSTCKG